VICSSETSVDSQQTTRRYIPEDGTLHNRRCENLKSYIHIVEHMSANNIICENTFILRSASIPTTINRNPRTYSSSAGQERDHLFYL
jgi:hypothetical protein